MISRVALLCRAYGTDLESGMFGFGEADAFEEVSVEFAGDEVRMGEDALVQRDCGFYAFDDEAVEGDLHADDGFGAVAPVGDELGDERVVIGGNYGVGVHCGVNANAWAAGDAEGGDASGRWNEGIGVLCIDAAFDGVAAKIEMADDVANFLAGGDADLRFHEIDARDHFGDGMLDLDARVHLDKVQIAGFFAEKFDGARAGVANAFESFGDEAADAVARGLIERDRRRFLENLLVAALERAFAFAEVNDAAMVIAHDLKFDVARALDQLLHVNIGTAECAFGFGARGAEVWEKFAFIANDAHAAAAPPFGGFDHDWIADLVGGFHCGVFVRDDAVAAGNDRETSFRHFGAGAVFLTHHADHVRRRADERNVRGLTDLGKVCVLRKETVAGMDGVYVGDFGGADNLRDIEIALGTARGPDANGFIGKTDVERMAIGFGIDGDRADAQLFARCKDAERNLTTIGNKDFLEHGAKKSCGAYGFLPLVRMPKSGSPYSTG